MAQGRFQIFRSALAGIEPVSAESCHSFPRHWHDTYGIGVIERGAQTSFSGRGMVDAVAGDIITVNPGELHDGMPVGDHGRAWRMLYLDPDLVRDSADDIGEGRSGQYELTRPVLRDVRLARSFGQLFTAMTTVGDQDDDLGVEGLLLGLLADIVHERQALDAAGTTPRAILIARNRIDDDPSARVTLAELAALCGLTRFQVLRGFVRQTGLTPHAYLVQRRLDLARRLIRQGMGLADIAAASGFADQSHMTRMFRRTYGIAPGAYAAARL